MLPKAQHTTNEVRIADEPLLFKKSQTFDLTVRERLLPVVSFAEFFDTLQALYLRNVAHWSACAFLLCFFSVLNFKCLLWW